MTTQLEKPYRIRVLLVEDHVVVRQCTRELLEQEPDLEVVGEAGDGEAAVALAQDLSPDIVLMDVAMPRVNGVEATRRIKEVRPASAILVLTAYDYDGFIFPLLEAGAAGYLLKTIQGHELVNAVRCVYAGESVLHPVVTRRLVERLCQQGGVASGGRPSEVLSEREMAVLKGACKGRSNREIGDELSISARTVQAHMRSVFRKLGVGSRCEAILCCLRQGWIQPEELEHHPVSRAA